MYGKNCNASNASPSDLSFTSYINVVADPHSDRLAAIEYDPGKVKVQIWQENQPDKPVDCLIQTEAQPTSTESELVTIGWSCDSSMIAGLRDTLDLVILLSF